MTIESSFTIELTRQKEFEFLVKFDWPNVAHLLLDEPPPLGHAEGPNASRVLAAAVANCLSASLLFCFSKAKVDVSDMRTKARVDLGRSDKGRLRVANIHVDIAMDSASTEQQRFARCAHLFEDFCVVTESVRHGIPVDVSVTVNGMPMPRKAE